MTLIKYDSELAVSEGVGMRSGVRPGCEESYPNSELSSELIYRSVEKAQLALYGTFQICDN